MMTFYYRLWAQMQEFGFFTRALVVTGIFSFTLYIFLAITYRIWKGLWLWLSMKMVCVWHILVSDYYFDTRIVKSTGEQARHLRSRQNDFIDKRKVQYEKKKEKLQLIKEGKKTFRIGWGVVIYLVLAISILGPKKTGIYVPVLGSIGRVYEDMERSALAAARYYEPFVKKAKYESERDKVKSETEDERLVYLRLSKRGRDGANIRREASQNSSKIVTVQGDASMVEISRSENGNWIFVELEDGTQGWIYHTLVEESK